MITEIGHSATSSGQNVPKASRPSGNVLAIVTTRPPMSRSEGWSHDESSTRKQLSQGASALQSGIGDKTSLRSHTARRGQSPFYQTMFRVANSNPWLHSTMPTQIQKNISLQSSKRCDSPLSRMSSNHLRSPRRPESDEPMPPKRWMRLWDAQSR